jgi:molybdopterin-guanine dinucleotide biosynthesis protein A
MFSAAILAGGRASRFGGVDKSALIVDGVRILDRQLAMLADVDTRGAAGGLDEILFVGRATAHPMLRTVPDQIAGCGPLGGIHAALVTARSAPLFVVACDMPFVTADLVAYLVALAADGADAVVPRTVDGYHPLCAVYGRACVDPIARRLDDRRLKVTDFFTDVKTRIVTDAELERFGDVHRLLRNVNTPLDHRALQGHQL